MNMQISGQKKNLGEKNIHTFILVKIFKLLLICKIAHPLFAYRNLIGSYIL